MYMFGVLIFLLAFAAVGIFIFKSRFGRSWFHLGKTKVNQVGDYATTIDPAGQMQQAAQDAAKELESIDDAIEECDKLRMQLERKVKHDTAQVAQARVSLQKLLNEGIAQTDQRVIQKAKLIRRLDADIASDNQAILDQVALYKQLTHKADQQALKIQAAQQEAKQLKVKLQLGEKTQKLSEMMQRYSPTSVANKMTAIDAYRQQAQDQLDGYQAQGRTLARRADLFGEPEEEVSEDISDVLATLPGAVPPTLPQSASNPAG